MERRKAVLRRRKELPEEFKSETRSLRFPLQRWLLFGD